nr:MAG TPA: hypothetical protein [Caudoviricetes sp.]
MTISGSPGSSSGVGWPGLVGGVVYNRQARRRRNSDVYSPPHLNVPQNVSQALMPCKATALRGFSFARRGVV